MKVTFRNIGVVQEAIIDLTKGLSIFCGPNNTGKTYIAYCLYGLMKLRNKPQFTRRIAAESDIFDESKPLNIIEHYRSQRSTLKSFIEREFLRSIPSIFGVDAETTKKLFGDAYISVSLPVDDDLQRRLEEQSFTWQFRFSDGPILMNKKKGTSEIRFTRRFKELSGTIPEPVFREGVLQGLVNRRLLDLYLQVLIPKGYIAPVERNSIFTFSKELAIKRNDLVDEMLRLKDGKSSDPFDLLERRATRYPLAVRDGLDIAEDMANFKKQTSEFAYFADEIEQNILGGKILINRDGQAEFSPSRAPRGVRLPMHISASVVKSFSALIIYFRHLATEGDCIIIDEPELNLHPDAQIIVARMLADIVAAGFKVVISTHSDYIIRELNNLMMVNSLISNQQSIPEAYEGKGAGILPSMVGAYLFHYLSYANGKPKNKVEAELLPIEETGFEVETIDRIITELNSTSQELYFLLENEETEADAE